MRSDAVKTGTQQAPHRSLFNALGMTKEEMDRPLVGIVSSYNEIVPGHMNLDKITQAVKLGVAMAGGTPVMFPAIAVCDGIARRIRSEYTAGIVPFPFSPIPRTSVRQFMEFAVYIPEQDPHVGHVFISHSVRPSSSSLPAA